MSFLPDDCWITAFTFLPRCDQIRCSRVCRVFNKLVSAVARTPLLVVIGAAPKSTTFAVWFLDESRSKWVEIPSLRCDSAPSSFRDRYFRAHSQDANTVWFVVDDQQFYLGCGDGLPRWEQRSLPLPVSSACALNDRQMLFTSSKELQEVALLSSLHSDNSTETAVVQHMVVARLSHDVYDLVPCGINAIYAFSDSREMLCCDTKAQQDSIDSIAVDSIAIDSAYNKWRVVWSGGRVDPAQFVPSSGCWPRNCYSWNWTHARTSDGKRYLYCSGGVEGTRCPTSQPDLYQFDTHHNHWQQRTSMHHDRVYHSLTWHGGRLYAIGGTRVRDDAEYPAMDERVPLNVVESYDPRCDVWRMEPPLPDVRTGHMSFSTTLL